MPQPTYVVCVYRTGAPEAIVGVGGFWRMVFCAAELVWRARWHLYERQQEPLGDLLYQLMDSTIEPPKRMH